MYKSRSKIVIFISEVAIVFANASKHLLPNFETKQIIIISLRLIKIKINFRHLLLPEKHNFRIYKKLDKIFIAKRKMTLQDITIYLVSKSSFVSGGIYSVSICVNLLQGHKQQMAVRKKKGLFIKKFMFNQQLFLILSDKR